jgi:hypothetical protein
MASFLWPATPEAILDRMSAIFLLPIVVMCACVCLGKQHYVSMMEAFEKVVSAYTYPPAHR